jgi:hypothetical protein
MYKLSIIIILAIVILKMIYDVIFVPTFILKNDYFAPVNYNDNIIFPFWNSPLRSTRNMSYDLRGDVPIPYMMTGPFNMSSRMPIQNRSLADI